MLLKSDSNKSLEINKKILSDVSTDPEFSFFFGISLLPELSIFWEFRPTIPKFPEFWEIKIPLHSYMIFVKSFPPKNPEINNVNKNTNNVQLV